MNFEPLRRALVRLFGPRATSVSPKITEDDIINRMVERGLVEPAMRMTIADRRAIEPVGSTDVRPAGSGVVNVRKGEPALDAIRRHVVQIESGAVDERPGIKPPPDPAVDAGWTWAAWQRELAALAMPGWAVCRFANRIGRDNAAFVFGIVRGSFGIWRQPFRVCAAGADSTEHILTCVTHLRSGLGIGIFADREVAAAAAEIADRVCPAWETLDPDDRVKWNEVHSRTKAAWIGIGVRYADDAHCHAGDGLTLGIYTRSPESVMAGRPEKLS